MENTIRYLQATAGEKYNTLIQKSDTMSEKIRDIVEINAKATTTINGFRSKKRDKTRSEENPTVWEKTQRLFSGRTRAEKAYLASREAVGELASKRKKSVKDLRILSNITEPINSKILCARTSAMVQELMAEISEYEKLTQSEDIEDFALLICEDGLGETVEKIEMLDTYLATDPSYENMHDTLSHMTNRDVIHIFAGYIIERFPEKTLEILALDHVYESHFVEKYFEPLKNY